MWLSVHKLGTEHKTDISVSLRCELSGEISKPEAPNLLQAVAHTARVSHFYKIRTQITDTKHSWPRLLITFVNYRFTFPLNESIKQDM